MAAVIRRLRRTRRQWLVADTHRARIYLGLVLIQARQMGVPDTLPLAVAVRLVRSFEDSVREWAEESER